MAITALTHIGICVSDLDRSRAFYRDGLGFKEVSKLSITGAPTCAMFETPAEDFELDSLFLERDGVRIELMHFPKPGAQGDGAGTPATRRGLTHLATRVDDVEATCQALEALGAKVLRQTWIENEDFQSTVVFVLDPDGVRIELVSAPGDPHAPLGAPA
jgi:lactoylglutathione lyase